MCWSSSLNQHAGLAVLLELVFGRRDGKTRLAAGHRRQPLAHADGIGQIGVVDFFQARLVIQQIHLRRPAVHEEVDQPLGLRREMRQLGQRGMGADGVFGRGAQHFGKHQSRQRNPPGGEAGGFEEMPAAEEVKVFL